MNTFSLLRFFLPLRNPAGFGLADFIELGVVALMLAAILLRGRIARLARQIAERPLLVSGLLFALPLALRLSLLAHHPVPVAQVSDDFSYLLLGDTLAHFRLANPVHPMHRFFETVFVLQEPSYSSIYPAGQGLALAFGQVVFHSPWAGVALSVGAFCALCGWMLRAWVPPVWALAGGVLAVMEFGPLNQWMNNYWGGAISAMAGCLVFGAVPRLRASGRVRDAVLLGVGMGLQTITRPFESVLLALCLLPAAWPLPRNRRLLTVALLAVLPSVALTLAQNRAVTGSLLRLPYMESREQYGVPATFTFQKMTEPRRDLTQEQKLDYLAQKDVHGNSPETAGRYLMRLASRVRFFRFFFLAPLYVALAFFLPALRARRYLWAVASVLVFFLGTNIYPYYYPHYIAAVTCLFVLFAIRGLMRLSSLSPAAARIPALLCLAHFIFWYGIHLFGNDALFIATGPYESWDYINFGDHEGRTAIEKRLAMLPGKQLLFVRYSSVHLLREWVHNEADIDASRVVRALDLGADQDADLIRYYPDRAVWLLEPDAWPPRLTPYPAGTATAPRPAL